MTIHRAAWILPVSTPPIADGALAVEGNRIVATGSFRDLRRRHSGKVIDHGEVTLLPGLVNAHTHLEWSFLRGKISPKPDFVSWMREITEARLAASPDEIAGAIRCTAAEISSGGGVAVGEVINNVNPGTSGSSRCLAEAGLRAVVFVELIQFHGDRAEETYREGLRFLELLRLQDPSQSYHLSPHAPYSVSPALFRLIKAGATRKTVHLAENEPETRLLENGGGAWREILEARGRWDPSWIPPGLSPVRYLDDLDFLDDRTLAVHLVRVDDRDIEILRRRGCAVCLCPRSNARLGVGRAPARRLLDAGLTVALGTDGLASNEDLDMLSEMRALADQNPDLTPAEILRSATLGGAIALGLDGEFGSLEPGKSSRFAVVPVAGGKDPCQSILTEGLQASSFVGRHR